MSRPRDWGEGGRSRPGSPGSGDVRADVWRARRRNGAGASGGHRQARSFVATPATKPLLKDRRGGGLGLAAAGNLVSGPRARRDGEMGRALGTRLGPRMILTFGPGVIF